MQGIKVLLLSLSGTLLACGGDSDPTPISDPPDPIPLSKKINPDDSRVSPAASCDEFREYVVTATARSVFEGHPQFYFSTPITVAAGDPAEFVSRTNIQEAGVDEADIIKADSNGTLYTVHDNSLIIIDAFPAEQMAERSRIDFDFNQQQFLLFENAERGIAFSTPEPDPLYDPLTSSLNYPPAGIYVSFIDLSNLDAPTVTGTMWVRGYNIAQRRIDDRAFVVFETYIEFARELIENPEWFALRDAYIAATNANDEQALQAVLGDSQALVRPAVMDMSLDELLPSARRAASNGYEPVSLVECGDVFRSKVDIEVGISSLISLSADGSQFSASSVLATANSVYVSPNSVYLTQSSRSWWWDLEQADETAIHQFSLTGTAPSYVASGIVDGSINNRFSLSEYDNHLRIATTQTRWDGSIFQVEATNHMFVLKEDGNGTLMETGAVRDFELNENIRSARFVGAKGYVVTFEQIDPLFTFDLTDPVDPRLVGTLEIPGFSTYMHTYDDNHILTIGRGEDIDNFFRPIRAQLFDVSVFDDPRLLHTYEPTFDGTEPADFQWSPALFDARAFTFVGQEQVMTIPLSIGSVFNADGFAGFLALDVDIQDGFSERSRVDHSDLVAMIDCTLPEFVDISGCQNGSFNGQALPERTVVILDGDQKILYSLSQIGLKATLLDDGQTMLGFVIFH